MNLSKEEVWEGAEVSSRNLGQWPTYVHDPSPSNTPAQLFQDVQEWHVPLLKTQHNTYWHFDCLPQGCIIAEAARVCAYLWSNSPHPLALMARICVLKFRRIMQWQVSMKAMPFNEKQECCALAFLARGAETGRRDTPPHGFHPPRPLPQAPAVLALRAGGWQGELTMLINNHYRGRSF